MDLLALSILLLIAVGSYAIPFGLFAKFPGGYDPKRMRLSERIRMANLLGLGVGYMGIYISNAFVFGNWPEFGVVCGVGFLWWLWLDAWFIELNGHKLDISPLAAWVVGVSPRELRRLFPLSAQLADPRQ
jgi:hypothetical protein